MQIKGSSNKAERVRKLKGKDTLGGQRRLNPRATLMLKAKRGTKQRFQSQLHHLKENQRAAREHIKAETTRGAQTSLHFLQL